MSKTTKRQQELESALGQAQQELTAARHELTERTASIQDLTSKAEDLTARLTDLEAELEQRPPALGIDLVDSDDPAMLMEGELRSSMEREAQLARRIAELEALRVMATVDEDDAALPLERARELDERIQALELQLEAARSREDALAARTVHANAVLADVGQRLAELGEQADRAERLDEDLARVTIEAAAAQAASEDASERLRTLEAEHVATLERADENERRAADAERRFAALEAELLTATAVLRNLEEIYRVIRNRVDAQPTTDPDADSPALPSRLSAPAGAFPVIEEEEPGFNYLSSADLVATATRELGSVVPGDLDLLEEIAALPAVKSEGVPVYPGLHVKAAVVLAEVAQRRPFDRGNERIALAATRMFFEKNGYMVVGGDEELAELGAMVSGGQLPLLSIAAALESVTTRTPAPGGATSIEGVKFAPGLPMNLE